MLDERLTAVVGVPNDNVTHWGISRVETVRRRAEYERLTSPNEDKVRTREWPLDELTLDVVRARWGSGSFRIHWFVNTPDHEDPAQRHISGGQGLIFVLDPIDEVAPEPLPAAPAGLPAGGGDLGAAFAFASQLMAMSDQRASQMLSAVSTMGRAGGGGDSDLAARLAGLEARIAADAERRTLEDAHRAELARRDEEARELRRRIEELEDDDDDGGGPGIFQPGQPLLESIGYAILNAAAKNPDMAMKVAGPLVERVMGAQQAASAPAAHISVRPPPPPPPPPVIMAAPPAPRSGGDRVRTPDVVVIPAGERRKPEVVREVREAPIAAASAPVPSEAPIG